MSDRVSVVNPLNSDFRVYRPGGSAARWYCPTASVTSVLSRPVSAFCAETVAPGMTPPLASLTVPVICAFWASAVAAPKSTETTTAAAKTNPFRMLALHSQTCRSLAIGRPHGRGGRSRQHRPDAQRGQRDGVTLAVFFESLNAVLPVPQILDVRHHVGEDRLGHEVDALALRRLVRGLADRGKERHLRPRVHRSPGRRRSAERRHARSSGPEALAALLIGEIDRGVLVDLLVVDERRKSVGPPPVARLVAHVHVVHVRIAVHLARDRLAQRVE